MCGRVAQSVVSTNNTVEKFSSLPHREAFAKPSLTTICSSYGDNFNLSPGMDCVVMMVGDNGELQVDRKKWGLLTKNGTTKKPLYSDEKEVIKLCFESLCYNARSDTLYSKPKFSKLADRGNTCIVALDGYFEWKSHPIPKMNKRKQPYFVYRKHKAYQDVETQQREPLLVAGLWTRVATGIPDMPELDSFTMLTTDASKQISWLHHRMPLCIWDTDVAKQWLRRPSEELKKKIDDAARNNINSFAWHKVTPEMSKLSFRSEEATKELQETTRSVRYFFAKGSLSTQNRKEDTTHLLSSDTSISENKNKVLTSGSTATEAAVAGISKRSSSSTKSDRKRQSTSSSLHFSPTKKHKSSNKSISSRLTTQNKSKQVSINTYFEKKK